MRSLLMHQAAKDDELVGVPRGQRQMLRHPDPRDIGFDRLEQTAIAGVGLRLGIERVELAHAAGEPQMNDGNVALRRRRRLRAQAQRIAIAQIPEELDGAHFQKSTAIEVVH